MTRNKDALLKLLRNLEREELLEILSRLLQADEALVASKCSELQQRDLCANLYAMLSQNEPSALATENISLRGEVAALRDENAQLRQQLQAVQQQLAAALAKIDELQQQAKNPPSFVKPNIPKAEPKPRKKRDPEHNRGRKRTLAPTRFVQHAADKCPNCAYQLRGRSIARRREVIDLPAPQPVEVSEHQIIKRWCPHCERWVLPKQPLAALVLGQGRLGVRISAIIAYLRCCLRLPVRLVRRYLQTMHQVTLSTGEISELLGRLYKLLRDEIAKLRDQARGSPILHADETGWRQGGRNGYVWVFCTPDSAGAEAVRYYEYDQQRGEVVVKRILGKFKGVLVSDFLGSYNIYPGKHQRCWVHLLRDLHELKLKHGDDEKVLAWVADVRALYDAAKKLLLRAEPPSQLEREKLYVRLVLRAHELGLVYAEAKQYKGHPCYGLCKRLLRHEDELFQFLLVAGLSADNNQAERSVRPLVIVRKISGGSRSEAGTQSRLGLFSLLETWRVRGLNPFDELLELLRLKLQQQQDPLPQI